MRRAFVHETAETTAGGVFSGLSVMGTDNGGREGARPSEGGLAQLPLPVSRSRPPPDNMPASVPSLQPAFADMWCYIYVYLCRYIYHNAIPRILYAQPL